MFLKVLFKKINLKKLIFVNNNCLNDSRVDCELFFNSVKLNEQRHRINSKLKEFENPFEHDEIMNTAKCGGKKCIIIHSFFFLPFFW
jgi:hypothetical protein